MVADACDPGGNCQRAFNPAIDPTDSTVYLIKRVGGVFKSTNRGDSWTPVTTGLPGVSFFYQLTIDPTNPRILYLTTDRSLFKSTDGGSNWTSLNTYLETILAIDPSAPTTLYGLSCSPRGVLKSLDGGASWTSMNTGLPESCPGTLAVSINPANSSTLYAATEADGVFQSTDGAASWTAMNTGLWPRSATTLAIAATTPSTVYVGTAGGSVYRLDASRVFSTRR